MKDPANKKYKPGCMALMSCAVYHEDGVCPGPYGKCTCDQIQDSKMIDPLCICGHEKEKHSTGGGMCHAILETRNYNVCYCPSFRPAETGSPKNKSDIEIHKSKHRITYIYKPPTPKSDWRELEWLKEHLKLEGYDLEKWDGSLDSYELGHLLSHFSEVDREAEERGYAKGSFETANDGMHGALDKARIAALDEAKEAIKNYDDGGTDEELKDFLHRNHIIAVIEKLKHKNHE